MHVWVTMRRIANEEGKMRDLVGGEAKPSLEAGGCDGRSGEEPVNTETEL